MVFQPTVLRLLPPVVSPVYTALPVSSANIVYLSIATTGRCSIIARLCPSLNHRKVHLFPCQPHRRKKFTKKKKYKIIE